MSRTKIVASTNMCMVCNGSKVVVIGHQKKTGQVLLSLAATLNWANSLQMR